MFIQYSTDSLESKTNFDESTIIFQTPKRFSKYHSDLLFIRHLLKFFVYPPSPKIIKLIKDDLCLSRRGLVEYMVGRYDIINELMYSYYFNNEEFVNYLYEFCDCLS